MNADILERGHALLKGRIRLIEESSQFKGGHPAALEEAAALRCVVHAVNAYAALVKRLEEAKQYINADETDVLDEIDAALRLARGES